tara:strand:- start:4121 stop:4357 length:237 start_codon:yes stop_codon:yes gene_type:complete
MDTLASLISMGVALFVGLLVGFFRGKKPPVPAPDTKVIEAKVEAVIEAHDDAQEKIAEAAESPTPATDLAALGNKRKR